MSGLQIYNSDGTSIVSSIDTTGSITGTGLTINDADAHINNITIGRGSGQNSGTNTAFGTQSLATNTTGSSNTAVGYTALQVNATGIENSAFGSQSLATNTTGYSNTAVGFNSLVFNTVGFQNSALGNYSLQGNTEGSGNTAVGYSGLTSNTTGNYNVSVGHQSLLDNSTGSYNTAIGSSSGGTINTTSSSTAIGAGAKFTGDNQIFLGTSTETIYVQGGLALKIGETLTSGSTPYTIVLVTPLSQIYFLGSFQTENTIYFDSPTYKPGQTITFRRLVNSTNSEIIKFSITGEYVGKMVPYNSNIPVVTIQFDTTNYSTTFIVGYDGFIYQTYLH